MHLQIVFLDKFFCVWSDLNTVSTLWLFLKAWLAYSIPVSEAEAREDLQVEGWVGEKRKKAKESMLETTVKESWDVLGQWSTLDHRPRSITLVILHRKELEEEENDKDMLYQFCLEPA